MTLLSKIEISPTSCDLKYTKLCDKQVGSYIFKVINLIRERIQTGIWLASSKYPLRSHTLLYEQKLNLSSSKMNNLTVIFVYNPISYF